MTISLILIPILLVFALNIPRVSGKTAYYAALAFFAWQLASVFFPCLGSQQFAGLAGKFFSFNIAADGISEIMIVSASVVAFVSLMTSKVFSTSDGKLFSLSNLMLLCIAGINGLVFAKDAFTMYVFIEVIAVASYIMISLDKKVGALEGGFKYLIISSIATVMMLFSVALFFLAAGGTGFAEISAAVKDYGSNGIVLIAIILFMCGLLIKGGLVPFHSWLSGAYSQAPAGVSVFLGGIITKTTGVFTLIRFLDSVTGFNGEIKTVLLITGALSVVGGALIAIVQKDFKRVLAYSSISQVGYIVLALGAGTALGVAAALFHIFNHAIFKSLLFVNSASVEKQTGRLDVDSFGGLGYKMPITSTTTAIAFLSASGIPPFSGFWSKLLIVLALWSAGYQGFAVLAVLASLLTMAYFVTLQKKVFFGELSPSLENVSEAPKSLTVPAIILGGITIAVGLLFPLVLKYFILPAAGL
ncbi:complex I subunit 5 family protein [Endomicrobium proavitum]|uniref:NADH:ubiquinone oxidoreductase subunit 6 (Chain J) n=1 Tax=Endomicrobium proavitum TaxID=1408281 RepID=A0A0G3WHN7_9BACT|nr:proton-conducting transporter membrane subunit [Endomicrobium proavitum]AKL97412.1 NADH:ubiquinone oxidoreductase subunit 6 (chain J) [Endomicrobium proavitum]